MLVFALDTSTPAVTAGLVSLEEGAFPTTLARRVTINPKAHCELLTPHVLECCADAGVDLADVDAIVAGTGPGPFTGLRVGLATAAALGDALHIPVYGVCSLDAIAVDTWDEIRRAELAARTNQDERVLAAQKLLVVTDARRREVYWATYSLQGILADEVLETADSGPQGDTAQLLAWAVPARLDSPAVNKPDDIPVTRVACVAGTRKYRSSFQCPHVDVEYPDPAALVMVTREQLLSAAAAAPLQPLYLRRPDAVPPRPRPVSAAITGLGERS